MSRVNEPLKPTGLSRGLLTEAELDELAFEIDECQPAKGKPLSMTRWRTRIGIRIREVQEESGLGERPERYSPAWLYMMYAKESLAEADSLDADELPFRLFEIYCERFQQPFSEKDAAPAAQEAENAEPAYQPSTGDQPSAANEPPRQEATEQSPAQPPTTDPVPPTVPSVSDVPVVPIVSAVPETADEPPQSAAQDDEPPPESESPDSSAPEVDWSAF